MSLGSRINEIRKEKNIGIDELCVLSGIQKGTLSKITAGITTNPTLDTVRSIARALDCRLDDFDDAPAPCEKKSPSFEDGDEELLKKYHQLSQYNRGRVSGYIDMLLEEAKSQEDSGCVAG